MAIDQAAFADTRAGAGVLIGLLGALTIEIDGRAVHVAGTHRRRLLAYLATRAGQNVSLESIVDAVWGDEPPATAIKTLQSHMTRLRRSLEAGGRELIQTWPGGYRLDVTADALDTTRFMSLVGSGRGVLRAGQPGRALPLLSAAMLLWRGRPYEEFADAEYARGETVHLEELRLVALECIAECQLLTGAAASAVPGLERLVRQSPGRESTWALLMRALYACGRQHDALDAFGRARHALAEEFGLEVGIELRSLEHQILSRDSALVSGSGTVRLASALRSPAPMVGRSAQRSQLLTAWRDAAAGTGRVTVVCGAIGSGRTRLVADLAAHVVDGEGAIEYVHAPDGLAVLASGPTVSEVDAVIDRTRRGPLLLVVDDAEWLPAADVAKLTELAETASSMPLLLVVVLDPSAGGTVVNAVQHLATAHATTMELGPLTDDEVAEVVRADGVDDDAIAGVVAVANGSPGAARREAAAWAERTAGDRLRAAAASSLRAMEAAGRAQHSMLDEVLELVAARARRDALRSANFTGRQPYRALASYGPQDAELFVGRERLVAELVALILERRFVVLVGPSGSGKSSLVRAGLLPLARSGRLPGGVAWRTNVIVPGTDPLAALDAVVGIDEPDSQLLIVDQFEEVFAHDTRIIERFVARLADMCADQALDARVVATIRADAYPALTSIPVLAAVAESSQLLVSPPTADELRRIVEEPARRTGVEVESEVSHLVLEELTGHDAALPLVSAAMAELWDHRDGTVLRAATFVAIGGVASSVERIGEAVVRQVGDERLESLRRALLSLAELSDEDVWQRRRVEVVDIAQDPAVLEALVDARLVVRAESSVEIVHEVVFRAWPRLASWLSAAQNGKQLERELRAAARAWDAQNRHDDDVLRGARLDAALEWAQLAETDVTPLVGELLAASFAHRGAEDARRLEELADKSRSNRRLRRLLVAAALAFAIALLGSVVAVVQRDRANVARDRARDAGVDAATQGSIAEHERQVATSERDQARIDRLVADSHAQLDSHADLSMLLAVEAWRRQQSIPTRGAMLAALTHDVSADLPATALSGRGDVRRGDSDTRRSTSKLLGFIRVHMYIGFALDISDDGAVLAVGGGDAHRANEIEIFDTASRRQSAHIVAPDSDEMRGFDLSPDGEQVVVGYADHLQLIDVATGVGRRVGDATEDHFSDPSAIFTPDSRELVVLDGSGSLGRWDVATGRHLSTTGFVFDGSSDMWFAGDLLAAVSIDPPRLALWDLAADVEVRSVSLESPEAGFEWGDWSLSPDGATLTHVQSYFGLLQWDTATGSLLPTPPTPHRLTSMAVDPTDPSLFAVASFSGRIVLYDSGERRVVGQPLRERGAKVIDLAVAPEARMVASLSTDGEVTLWGDNAGAGPIDTPLASDASVPMPAGDRLVVLTHDFTSVEIRDAAHADSAGIAVAFPIDAVGDVQNATPSADGSAILVVMMDGVVFVSDAKTGALRWSLTTGSFPVGWAGISDDAHFVGVANEGELRIYDIRSAAEVARLQNAEPGFYGPPVFTPDGRSVDIITHTGPRRYELDDPSHVVDVQNELRSQGTLAHVPGTDDVVAFGGEGGVLTRWNMTSGAVVGTGRSQEASNFLYIAVSPDGSTIAALHYITGSLSLFDSATMQEIGMIPTAESQLRTPAFAADGRLLSDGLLHTATAWDLDPEHWRAAACHAAGRNLTRQEWAEYLGDEPYRATCQDWPAAD